MREYILHKPGKPKNLKLKKIEIDLTPKKDQVLVDQKAIGVNYLDIHFRNGDYKLNKTPAILGIEACGVIEKVGDHVIGFKVGDRVAYATAPIGSYTKKRIVRQNFLVKVPSDINNVIAAGSLMKGLMAHTLLYRSYVAVRAKRILVHAAAGGVGQFLCSWAKHLGLEVIGTVGSEKKLDFAKKFGCHHVINYSKNDFVKEIAKITNNAGVGAVYDGVGGENTLKSLSCLWPMGICINYGEVAGQIPPIDINHLLLNSLYLNKTNFFISKANRVELALGAAEVFDKIRKGIINPHIKKYSFDDLPAVHQKMQDRKTIGSQVLVFGD